MYQELRKDLFYYVPVFVHNISGIFIAFFLFIITSLSHLEAAIIKRENAFVGLQLPKNI